MREFLVILGLIAVGSTAPLGQSGPVKISDNNIENIFNINININGVFTNHIEQDIVSVVVALLNQQGIIAGGGSGSTLKEQLMELASKSESKDLNVDVPASSLAPQFNFEGLEKKIREAIAQKSADGAPQKEASQAKSLDEEAKQLMQKFIASNPQLKL